VQVHEGDSNAYQDQEDARQDQVHEEGRSHREEHEEDGREVQGLSVDEARHGGSHGGLSCIQVFLWIFQATISPQVPENDPSSIPMSWSGVVEWMMVTTWYAGGLQPDVTAQPHLEQAHLLKSAGTWCHSCASTVSMSQGFPLGTPSAT